MKKLRLMAIRSNKDALLKELICKGCVEFSEIEGEVQDSDFKELLKRESSSLMTFKSQHMALVNAVGILDRYSPAKKPLLSALPEVGEDVLLDDSGVGAALAAACLAAEGTSFLGGYEHIRRGYEDICRDLAGAGARIELLSQAENIFSDDRRKETDGIWTRQEKNGDPSGSVISVACDHSGRVLHPDPGDHGYGK